MTTPVSAATPANAMKPTATATDNDHEDYGVRTVSDVGDDVDVDDDMNVYDDVSDHYDDYDDDNDCKFPLAKINCS